MYWFEKIASRFSLEILHSPESLNVTRNNRHVHLDRDLPTDTPLRRWVAWNHLLGIRLGIDLLSSEEFPEDEPPAKPVPGTNKNLAASPFGERLPRLASRLAIDVCERISGQSLFSTDSILPHAKVIYLRDIGKRIHAITDSQAGRHYKPGKLEEISRSALFHEPGSYRPRPKVHKTRHGRIREYQSSDGIGASRLLLLPDFDFDASREAGWAAVPSWDTLLVAEPSDPQREDLKLEMMTEALSIWRRADLPFFSGILSLSSTGIELTSDAWTQPEFPTKSETNLRVEAS